MKKQLQILWVLIFKGKKVQQEKNRWRKNFLTLVWLLALLFANVLSTQAAIHKPN